MKELLKRESTTQVSVLPNTHQQSCIPATTAVLIPSNVLTYANTQSGDPYQTYCRKNNFLLHCSDAQVQL